MKNVDAQADSDSGTSRVYRYRMSRMNLAHDSVYAYSCIPQQLQMRRRLVRKTPLGSCLNRMQCRSGHSDENTTNVVRLQNSGCWHMQAAGYLQRKIAHQLELPELRVVSGRDASTSGRFIRTRYTHFQTCIRASIRSTLQQAAGLRLPACCKYSTNHPVIHGCSAGSTSTT